MRRKTFDVLTSAVGLALAVVLLAAGGLRLWAPARSWVRVSCFLRVRDQSPSGR